jgi:cyclic pyranopterin phosphate synthase
LTKIDGLLDISLTTNGILLKDNIQKIRSAGIKRINISLDTLDPKKFKEITGLDQFHQVWDGIEQAQALGFDPIKLNVVALKGINDDEFADIARLSFSYPFHIRFIEYMPIGNTRRKIDDPVLVPEIKNRLISLGRLVPVENGMYDGPAERYKFEGSKGEIGFISALSHHFCDRCNRLRLTANGHLRACLLSNHQEDLKGPLRQGYADSKLVDVFIRAVKSKPFEHTVAIRNLQSVPGQMCAIGG